MFSMYYSIMRLSYLVTFLTETTDPINLIFGVYIHGTSRRVIGYIILTFQVINDHLWTKDTLKTPTDSIDLIFGVYIHGTSRRVLGYIILIFQVIKDHLWTTNTLWGSRKCGVAGGYIFFVQNWSLQSRTMFFLWTNKQLCYLGSFILCQNF